MYLYMYRIAMILANVQIERNKYKNAYKQISMGQCQNATRAKQNICHLFLLYF